MITPLTTPRRIGATALLTAVSALWIGGAALAHDGGATLLSTDSWSTAAFPLTPADYDSVAGASSLELDGVSLGAAGPETLVLSRTDVLAPGAELIVAYDEGELPAERPAVALFSGYVSGLAESSAFVAVSPWFVHGFVQTEGHDFVISSGPHGQGLPTIIFDLTTMPAGTIEWAEFICRADELAGGVETSPADGGASYRGAPCRRATTAIETDREFTTALFGGDADASMAYATALIAAVTEIYQRDVNARMEIVFLRVWTGADPWNEDNTIDQIYQFQDYWNANMTHIVRNSAHFLSGRALGGGVAYYPGLCQDGFDYALSANLNGFFPYPLQDNHPQNWDMMVTAHEYGHNYGAPHTHSMNPPVDNCASGDCSVAPNGTIMSYCHLCSGGMINIVLRFHDRTINETILPYLANDAPCNLEVPNLDGDLDGDCDVDFDDMVTLLGCYGTSDCGDVDGDGDTDFNDLVALLADYGN